MSRTPSVTPRLMAILLTVDWLTPSVMRDEGVALGDVEVVVDVGKSVVVDMMMCLRCGPCPGWFLRVFFGTHQVRRCSLSYKVE